jgi:hypothetical protein
MAASLVYNYISRFAAGPNKRGYSRRVVSLQHINPILTGICRNVSVPVLTVPARSFPWQPSSGHMQVCKPAISSPDFILARVPFTI